MRGRTPIPDYIKRMTGNPGKRPLRTAALTPCERPSPPECLSPASLAHWHRVVPLLEADGRLTAFSGPALLSYCAACADLEAVAALETRMGKARLKPRKNTWRTLVHLRAVKKAAETTMRTFEQEYGLTPASASRVALPSGPSAVDEFAAFLAKKPQIPDLTHDAATPQNLTA